MQGWLDNMKDADGSKRYGDQVREMLFAHSGNPLLDRIERLGSTSPRNPTGFSWATAAAYDISFGGIDHVLATGEDINVMVYDTEVYSNTGGQSSKATPTGSIAKFAASGKKTAKKDLGGMAMTYGYVYVASVGMGANKQQLMKAFTEAEGYDGPSLIMAYSPCINHGIKRGMGKTQEETKPGRQAVTGRCIATIPCSRPKAKIPLAWIPRHRTAACRPILPVRSVMPPCR
jgi:pyruvate-ferredoxin/flavodoxin oxidoreductase